MNKLSVMLVVGVAWSASGKELKTGNAEKAEARSAQEQRKAFTVAEGFSVELVASEEQGASKPISLAFDDTGRLWTHTATEYPQDKNKEIWKAGGRDKVLVIDEPWRASVHTPRVFAEGLAMPVSVLPWKGGVVVAQGPDMLFLADRNGDGKADARETWLTGFGFQDTHTGIHQLTRMPGGWIDFNQGCLTQGKVKQSDGILKPFNRNLFARFKPGGTDLQVIGAGMNNAWAWAVARDGRIFTHEANDFGYSVVPFERDASYPSFFATPRYPDSPLHPPTAQGLNLGGTGFSGMALTEGTAFTGPWGKRILVANPITGSINSVTWERDAGGVYTFTKKEDVVTCADPMFRPVSITMGPDGCLYIADWYNRIISHNEVPRDHPARDKTRGRIWRVRPAGVVAAPPVNVAEAKTEALPRILAAGKTWEMRAAWHQIVDRKAATLIPELVALAGNAGDVGVRVHALWSLEGLGHFDRGLWDALLRDENTELRHQAVRALSTLQPPKAEVDRLLLVLKPGDAFRVLNEAVRFYRDTPHALGAAHITWLDSLVTPKGALPKDKVKGWKGEYKALGGAYEKAFLNLLVQKVKTRDDEPPPEIDMSAYDRELAKHPARPKAEQDALTRRIAETITAVEGARGIDIALGKTHFTARCSLCHSLSDTGAGFAPPLAGGLGRSVEGIITSVLDPHAAVEGAFVSYRMEKKDGSVVEGYKSAQNAKGITLTFMGGAKMVVPLDEIKASGYVAGKSSMPDGLDAGLSTKDLADLVGYIRGSGEDKVNDVKALAKATGFVEAEACVIQRKTKGLNAHVQVPGGRFPPSALSGRKHVFIPAKKEGDFVEWVFDVGSDESVPVTLYVSRCYDFGLLNVYVNGKQLKKALPMHNPDLIVDAVSLGDLKPENGRIVLRMESAGVNAASAGVRLLLGLDFIRFGKVIPVPVQLLSGREVVVKKVKLDVPGPPVQKELPPTKVKFRKQVLFEKYLSEGASIGDVDNDAHMDVISGNLWWKGPAFTESFAYGPVKTYPITGPGLSAYSQNFFTFPDHLSNDSWVDIVKVGIAGQNSTWAKNPGEKPLPPDHQGAACAHCVALVNVGHESPQWLDVIGDEKKELLAHSGGYLTLGVPTGDEKAPWERVAISAHNPRAFPAFLHGLGAGDVNGDGLQDVLIRNGWFEQPKNWDRKSVWAFHAVPFAPGQGGAQMFAFDVNGDGANDVVTALVAHGYGFAWHEQVKGLNGKIDFKRHDVMTDTPSGNPYGVCFSQPHAMDAADIDGDGVMDVVTGKCFFAHNGKDPGAHDPAVLYWFRTVRHADGSAELVPYLIDDNSGVGRQVTCGDLNGDGKVDIVVGNKKGVFAFVQE